MILIIDNYDSFTWNLVQYFGELRAEVIVHRNDQVTASQVFAARPTHIVVSPGPGRPEQAGISVQVIIGAIERGVPLLGVCLGHQAIAAALGGSVVRADKPVHGKTSPIEHDGRGVFAGLRQGFVAGRYHSLVVSPEEMPCDLEIAGRVQGDGPIMGIRHRARPVHGVQFHPESVLTEAGHRMLSNFLAEK